MLIFMALCFKRFSTSPSYIPTYFIANKLLSYLIVTILTPMYELGMRSYQMPVYIRAPQSTRGSLGFMKSSNAESAIAM